MTSQHSQRWIAHFSGQATPWRTELAELVSDPALAERLAERADEASAEGADDADLDCFVC